MVRILAGPARRRLNMTGRYWEDIIVTASEIVIDPATSAPVALRGRIVTMDRPSGGTVIADGVVFCRDGAIVAVQPAAAPAPPGFETVTVVSTEGTVFPGLVELHNHLPYDVLALWQVPKCYGDRDQWSGTSNPDYRRLITGPMQVLGSDPRSVAAVVRWVEMRCLLGGTTTSQGVTLASDPGLITHFRGLVRNVESTGDPRLPPAATHIADVEAADRAKFLARISGSTKMILHLAEGVDTAAHNHFAALEDGNGSMGDHPQLDRDPLCRTDLDRLRGARRPRRFDGVVPVLQPAALRARRPTSRQLSPRASGSHWDLTGRPRAAKTCSGS